MRRQLALTVAAVLLAGGTGGCATLRDVPMPGLVDGPTHDVTAVFESALGLPEQAAVKMDGATIGEVGSIRTVDYAARVQLHLSDSVEVPANVRAELRFASPMGEAFVELVLPPDGGTGVLAEHAVIGLKRTTQAPGVADLLAAVSSLVTGGSFADMKVVVTELNTALRGNAGNVRSLLERLDGLARGLNEHTAEFDAALDSMDRLGRELAGDRELLGRALVRLQPAVRTLSAERQEIFRLMGQLRRLSRTGTATIEGSRTALLSVLSDLGPVLDTLTRNERVFAPILDGIGSFARQTDSATYGLFINFDLTIKLAGSALTPLSPQAIGSLAGVQ